ncbi:MATE family efflux transporter [Sphingomonas prati]|uniref:Putative MATE family efflux protein n=1 Tax=Sphingomonas prati TaxID=1843237 RepID=A0A7W9BT04_9SPHN|nr:MATE family efflux transporter [Sphingomonas prati]MBB5729583.1 putative MATE family efflux protein [Sphingomonas prati]GGE76337.1 MATE family efflux transporter [Sphingomonas prati]
MATHGSRPNLTTGAITPALLMFALPTLGSNVLQSLNGSINAIWVGRYLGEGALAATSNANLIMFLMFAAVFGFGMAATILVGQATGRGDPDGARRSLGSAIGMLVGGSFVIALLGWVFAPQLLRLLATPPAVQDLALIYLRVIFLSMPAAFLLVLLMMGLRGTGDSLTPLWFMVVSTVVDSGLNPILIAGAGPIPAMGIAGSATATLIANHVGLGALLVYIYARDLPIRLRGREWRYLIPDPVLLRAILAKGAPLGLQMMVVSVSGLAMIGLVNRQGLVTTAAYGVALQLWTYIQMPAMAIGAAVSAMAAQNIGAGRWDRIGAITRAGIVTNLALTGAMVVVTTLVDRAALGLFLASGSPAIPIAAHIHLIAGWSFVLFGVTMVLFSTVRANGAVVAPLIILAITLLPVRLGFARLLQPVLGTDALWWSFPVGMTASLLLATAYYLRGTWRRGSLLPEAGRETALADADAAGRDRPTG